VNSDGLQSTNDDDFDNIADDVCRNKEGITVP